VGLDLDWLTFDAGYGDKPGFLQGLDGQGVPYIGEVPKSFRCFTAPPRPGQTGHRADNLVRHSPAFHRQPWQAFRLERQTLGEQTWQAKAAPVWLSFDGVPGEGRYALIWARNERTGEQKYFVAGGGAAGTPLGRQLRVGFTRWNVEHGLRLSNSELGFRHFEERSYTGLMRHLTLCLLTLTFVAGQAEGLRGKNPEVTAEQVCRGLNWVCRNWLARLRGTTELRYTAEVIGYHQQRNRAARESRRRRRRGLPAEYMQPAARRTRRRQKRRGRQRHRIRSP